MQPVPSLIQYEAGAGSMMDLKVENCSGGVTMQQRYSDALTCSLQDLIRMWA